ncbi:hypothetical protein ZWY2020_013196 [Hordeum vulgare]|nr:hypothetical protein ZWY2020_013196 [Hordeum vulgare]
MGTSSKRSQRPANLISALPEELLLEILERLGSARAAAGTSLLSRRWRGLWTRLPSLTLTLHDVPFGSIKAALRRAAARPGVYIYHLDIRIAGQADMIGAGHFSSLLWDAASLSPVELRLALPRNLQVSCIDATLPSFHRATSIDLRARALHLIVFAKPYALASGCWYVPFRSLERLSLSGCHIDLATLIPFCPRLRVLRVNTTGLIDMSSITVHSASLEELVVEHGNRWTRRTHVTVSVDSPVLKRFTASFHACGNIEVSILAPMVEKVSWQCSYARPICRLGLWGLSEVGLNDTQETHGQTDTDSGRDACVQLPSVHVLSLHISPVQDPVSFPDAELSFAAEIDKHMVTNFSGLDLHLSTKGHVFGAFVMLLLGMHRIRTSLRNFKIVLLRSEVKDACPVNCLCYDPKNWRTESITLADLENMEIEGVGREDHEFDFLKLIFRCAPMLKTVAVRLSDGFTPSVDWCTKINNIFMAYPSVECNADLNGLDGRGLPVLPPRPRAPRPPPLSTPDLVLRRAEHRCGGQEYADLNLRPLYPNRGHHLRIRQHVNPLSALFVEPTEPPEWTEVFEDPLLPLMVDIGCGSGRFLVWLAKNSGEKRNYLGLEIRQKLVERTQFWVTELGLRNVYFMFANATVSFEQIVSSYPGPLSLVSILCPDPHFKKRHHKRRVLQTPLVDSITKNLCLGGRVFVQSDVLDVATDMRERFDGYSDVFEHADRVDKDLQCDNEGWLLDNPMGIRTEREIHAELEGATIYRRMYEKTRCFSPDYSIG